MNLKPYIFILCCVSLFSCSGNSHTPDTGQKKIQLQNNINHSLPFGSSLLSRYKNLQRWSGPLNDDTTSKRDPQQMQYQKIADSYYAFTQKKSIHAPDIKEIEYVKIGKDSLTCHDDKHFYEDFKYRLPDFGSYECYYQTGSFYNRTVKAQQTLPNGCMYYGNIVLISAKTKKATVLNVYYGRSGELVYFNRMFYINKDSSIDIYESTEFEGETSIRKAFKVTIDKTGGVIIKNI